MLRQAAFRQPFADNRITVLQVQPCRRKDTHIASPRRTLPRRTVCRHIAEIGLLAPDTVVHQLIHIGIGAIECSQLLHF